MCTQDSSPLIGRRKRVLKSFSWDTLSAKSKKFETVRSAKYHLFSTYHVPGTWLES